MLRVQLQSNITKKKFASEKAEICKVQNKAARRGHQKNYKMGFHRPRHNGKEIKAARLQITNK